ncbi:VWA domain-containing protein [Algivirga pacifica]|uniref:VWFA domain-containing protein n=1 Tax=Algivirga pacifica TaxID=1162670 RepID=A0ABP9D3W2_9BACT
MQVLTKNIWLYIGFSLLLSQVLPSCKSSQKETDTPPTVQQTPPKPTDLEIEFAEEVEVADEMVVGAPAPAQRAYERKVKDAPMAPPQDSETYHMIEENTFLSVNSQPRSTFSIDVDKASYANMRRMLNMGQQPDKDAVKIEELINYFDYDYPQPKGQHPIAVITETATCPWNTKHQLLHIGLKGKELPKAELKPNNLVFLLDVSGSMSDYNKLPLLKSSLEILLDQLNETDKVAIVVYAGAAGIVLPSTPVQEKDKILAALNQLEAGGSTAGGEGIELAYKVAEENFLKEGNNRIILATDGDFNVGANSPRELQDMIEEKRTSGIYLTCLGFGMGNYRDDMLETLSQKGNGNHAYIDTRQEALKVLGTEFAGTLYTIAKDVKIQVEFNPATVQAYRLIGYENRKLNNEDFQDDKKDAGEIGAGHTVTALYEVIPTGVESEFLKDVEDLKYQETVPTGNQSEIATVKFRYKPPQGTKSILMEEVVKKQEQQWSKSSENFRFSAAVALFGMLLRDSKYVAEGDKKLVSELATEARGKDEEGYRAEFIRLVRGY